MLVTIGGKERTEDEWHHLAATEGFRISAIAPAGATHLIELRPA